MLVAPKCRRRRRRRCRTSCIRLPQSVCVCASACTYEGKLAKLFAGFFKSVCVCVFVVCMCVCLYVRKLSTCSSHIGSPLSRLGAYSTFVLSVASRVLSRIECANRMQFVSVLLVACLPSSSLWLVHSRVMDRVQREDTGFTIQELSFGVCVSAASLLSARVHLLCVRRIVGRRSSSVVIVATTALIRYVATCAYVLHMHACMLTQHLCT